MRTWAFAPKARVRGKWLLFARERRGESPTYSKCHSRYFGSQFVSGYFDNNGRFIETDTNNVNSYYVGGGTYDPNIVYSTGSSSNNGIQSNKYDTEAKVVYLNGSPVTVTGYSNNDAFYTLNPDHIGTLYDNGQFDMSGRWNPYN